MQTSITVISDTHWRHEELHLPAGDVLIHCGDMFDLFGDASQSVQAMDDWFGRQKFDLILCTGGNHDRVLERALKRHSQPFKNAHFLSDTSLEFCGLKIFGAPWTPNLPTHAFPKDSLALTKCWRRIPQALDILVTHTPPRGIFDTTSRGQSHGCVALANAMKRVAPRIHCFGHVHASAGQATLGETTYINASSLKSKTCGLRLPTTFNLSPKMPSKYPHRG